MISVVIPAKDALEITRRCVAALFEHAPRPFELILVDNGSRADFVRYATELARERPEFRLVRNERNEGFAFAVNQGLLAARGEPIVVMNNDVIVTSGAFERMLTASASDPRIGVVGPVTNRASGPQEIAVPYDVRHPETGGLAAFAAERAVRHAGQVQFLSRIVGLCVLVKRTVLETIGGFDTAFFPGNFEDDDFSLRSLRAGFTLAVAQDAFVHHHGSKTFAELGLDYARTMHDNWRWFCSKWEHRGALGPYPARALALRRAFDRGRDFVPLDARDAFRPSAAPIALDAARAVRFLVIADATDEGWISRVTEYCRAFRAADPVSLVVRIDPPVTDVIEIVSGKLSSALERTGIADAELPDVLVDSTPLSPLARGGLYTAVHALLDPGDATIRAPVQRREAVLCGIEIVEAGEAGLRAAFERRAPAVTATAR